MYKIIGADGREYGPISAAVLQQWIAEGRTTLQTRVQLEGSQDWKTLAEIPEFATPPMVIQPTGPVVPQARAGERHQLTPFSVPLLILLHYLTCGIFSLIWMNLMHGRLPRVRSDDPDAGRAVGFSFIPFFNLYWCFVTYRRLCVRVDEQRGLYGLPPGNLLGLATAACVFKVIPYLNVFIGYTIMFPIFIGKMQASVNELVKVSATTEPRGVLQATTAKPGMSGGVVAGIVIACLLVPCVIGVLAGMLLPALAAAREKGHRTLCLNNLKQINLALSQYEADANGQLPSRKWCDALVNSGHLASPKVLLCPSGHAKECGYVFNGNVLGTTNWQNEADLVIVLDGELGWNALVKGPRDLPASPHHAGYNVLFEDGHVEFVPNSKIGQLRWLPQKKINILP